MTLPNDTARCMGQEVPFGSEYTIECKTCARSRQNGTPFSWSNVMGPVLFEMKCFYKIERVDSVEAAHGIE